MEEKNLQPEELNEQNLQETQSEATEDQTHVVEESSNVMEKTIATENERSESETPENEDKTAIELPNTSQMQEIVLTEPSPETVIAETPAPDAVEESAPEENVENSSPSETHEEVEEVEAVDAEDEDEDEEEEMVSDDHYASFTREQLVQELENLVASEDITRVKAKVSLVKMAYLKQTREVYEAADENLDEVVVPEEDNQKTQGDEMEAASSTTDETQLPQETEVTEPKKEHDPLAERYKAAFRIYKSKREKFLQELEEQKLKNLEGKKVILEQLRDVINSEESLKKSYDEFRQLQEKWREIGMVPKGEVNDLWQSYHFLVEKFFDKVKISNELRDLDLKKNLEKKLQLCEKSEELLLETSIIKSFKKLQELHQEWKETGPVPTDKKDELWERFKTITDKINERRRDHYNRIKEDQEANYNAKRALFEQLEEIVNVEIKGIKEWQTKTNSVNEMLKIWKTIGPAPKVKNDEIWDQFKSYLDAFFAKKKEYFSKLKDQQVNNYNLKLDLCNQAESIKESDDWKETTRTLIDLQKKWKVIGPVPKKYSDKIWKRFRAACDDFFNRKEDYFGHIHEREADNLTVKKEIIERLKNQEFTDNKDENLNILKTFQREWMNIGHVPIKEKDAIQKEFRKIIDAKLELLKINEMEISTMNFKNRVENIKDSSDSNRILSRERIQLMNKISQMNDDINLWENNIGFLAASKNANILKNEFEKKIQRAKQEVALMNVKLKYLNDQM